MTSGVAPSFRRVLWEANSTVDAHRDVPLERWLRSEVEPSRIIGRVDDLATLRTAVLAGADAAHLLCWIGDATPELCRVGPPFL